MFGAIRHRVSIPSEVGRGRALHVSAVDDTKVHRSVSFQSPRRWGGVGLPAHAEGHGANLGQRVSIPSEVGRGRAGPSGKPCSTPSCLVSIPSEVGRGRAGPSGKPCSTPSCLVSIPSEVGRGRASSRPMTFGQCEKIGGVEFQSPRRWGGVGLETLEISMDTKAKVQYKFQSPRRWGGVGLSGRCNDWPDMSLGSGFPYPPENGTKLGSLSLAPGSPGKRKRREQNRLRQVVTGARNRVNQGYEIRQSKKRRARPPRSGTGTRQGARRKPETRRGPVHSPRIETGQGRRCPRA